MLTSSIIVIASFLILAPSGTLASYYYKNKCKGKLRKVPHHHFEMLLSKYESEDTCECGTSSYKGAQDFIISGTTVEDATKYPFTISIHKTDSLETWRGCGGALISPTFVITAAHCVYNATESNPKCKTHLTANCYHGPNDLLIGFYSEKTTRWPETTEEIEKIIPHPHFSTISYPNDIALIKLKKPKECSIYARPICINAKEIVGIGQNIQIAGYGWKKPNTPYTPDRMLEGVMQRVEDKLCGNQRTVLCAIGETQSICYGDSGTVSFVQRNGRYFAVGISSRGAEEPERCGEGSATIFMSISRYYEFIADNVNDLPNH